MRPISKEPSEDQPLLGKTVLFAEDEARIRLVVSMMIEELGAEVVAVEDCTSAIAEYASKPGNYDVVLMDMRMKGLSGDAAFSQLLKIDPKVKVVLASGIRPEMELIQILEKHGGGFIEKPFNVDRLSHVLGAVVRGAPT